MFKSIIEKFINKPEEVIITPNKTPETEEDLKKEEIKYDIEMRRQKIRAEKEIEKKRLETKYKKEIEMIEREAIPDQVWQVSKMMPSTGKMKVIASYDHRPDEIEIIDDLSCDYGGGKYYVKTTKPNPMLVFVTEVEGDPEEPEKITRERKKRKNTTNDKKKEDDTDSTELDKEWREKLAKKLLESDEELARKWLIKELIGENTDHGKTQKQTLDDIVINEIKKDPELSKEYARNYVASKMPVKKESDIDIALKAIRMIKEAGDMMNGNNEKNHSNSNVWAEVFSEAIKQGLVRDIGEILKSDRREAPVLPAPVQHIVVPQYNHITDDVPTMPHGLNTSPNNISSPNIVSSPNNMTLSNNTSLSNNIPSPSGISPSSVMQSSNSTPPSNDTSLSNNISQSNTTLPPTNIYQYIPILVEYINRDGDPAAVIDIINAFYPSFINILSAMNRDMIVKELSAYKNTEGISQYIEVLLSPRGLAWIDELIGMAIEVKKSQTQYTQEDIQTSNDVIIKDEMPHRDDVSIEEYTSDEHINENDTLKSIDVDIDTEDVKEAQDDGDVEDMIFENDDGVWNIDDMNDLDDFDVDHSSSEEESKDLSQ